MFWNVVFLNIHHDEKAFLIGSQRFTLNKPATVEYYAAADARAEQCQVDLLGCGAKARKRPLQLILSLGLMLIIGYRPSLSAIRSENDF